MHRIAAWALVAGVALAFSMSLPCWQRARPPAATGSAAPAVARAGSGQPATPRAAASVLAGIDFDRIRASHWKLPERLDEISGLAVTSDGRVLAHEDQHGYVYELDPANGRIVKRFAFGHPVVKADFEGIAVADGRIYLVSSRGVIYAGDEAADGEHVPFLRFESGVAERCEEVEGLAWDGASRSLAILCKRARGKRRRSDVWVHRWSPDTARASEGGPIRVDASALRTSTGGEEFAPSGLEWHAPSGHYLLLSSAAHALAEVDASGQIVALQELPARDHRQPEGLAIDQQGRVLVADEAHGHKARLTIYPTLPAPSTTD